VHSEFLQGLHADDVRKGQGTVLGSVPPLELLVRVGVGDADGIETVVVFRSLVAGSAVGVVNGASDVLLSCMVLGSWSFS